MSDPRAPILVAVDFSDDSLAALSWAAAEADAHRLDLVVLHVVHDPGSAPGTYGRRSSHGAVRSLEEAAADMFEAWMAQARERVPDLGAGTGVSTRLVTGLPASRIVEVAREIGARHIVVGSRGRTGLDRLLLGSKAQRVAQLAEVPVTIVKRPTVAS